MSEIMTPQEFKDKYGDMSGEAKKSYSGKRGCMCGCLGKYSTHTGTMKAAYTRLMKEEEIEVDMNSDGTRPDIISVTTETRINAVYFVK